MADTWTFRATNDVPELGIREGDGVEVRADRTVLLARTYPATALPSLIPHIIRFRSLRGPGLRQLLELAEPTAEQDGEASGPALRVL